VTADSVQLLTGKIYAYAELFDTGQFDAFAAQFGTGSGTRLIERVEGDWRRLERRVIGDLSGDVSHHVR